MGSTLFLRIEVDNCLQWTPSFNGVSSCLVQPINLLLVLLYLSLNPSILETFFPMSYEWKNLSNILSPNLLKTNGGRNGVRTDPLGVDLFVQRRRLSLIKVTPVSHNIWLTHTKSVLNMPLQTWGFHYYKPLLRKPSMNSNLVPGVLPRSTTLITGVILFVA